MALISRFLAGGGFILRVRKVRTKREYPTMFNTDVKSVKPHTRRCNPWCRVPAVYGAGRAWYTYKQWEERHIPGVGVPGYIPREAYIVLSGPLREAYIALSGPLMGL